MTTVATIATITDTMIIISSIAIMTMMLAVINIGGVPEVSGTVLVKRCWCIGVTAAVLSGTVLVKRCWCVGVTAAVLSGTVLVKRCWCVGVTAAVLSSADNCTADKEKNNFNHVHNTIIVNILFKVGGFNQ